MKKILVTGGAGFIGSHLCRQLLKLDNQVVCVDNFFTGKKANIEDLLSKNNFSLIKADVSQMLPDKISQSQWQEIYHLASPAGPHPTAPKSYLNYPVKTYLVNSIGTHQLLKLASKSQAKFLFASTSEIYGDPQVHLQTEDYHGNVNPIGPRACYNESKRFAEMAVSVWAKKGVNARIIRIFNTYGPNMNPDDGRAVITFITKALKSQPINIFGDGQQTRSFCYIDDLVKGIILAMNRLSSDQVVNLGNPQEITIKSLAEKIIQLTKSKSKINYQNQLKDDPQKRKPDIAKAKSSLGWQPEIDLDTGLIKTIDWAKRFLSVKI